MTDAGRCQSECERQCIRRLRRIVPEETGDDGRNVRVRDVGHVELAAKTMDIVARLDGARRALGASDAPSLPIRFRYAARFLGVDSPA